MRGQVGRSWRWNSTKLADWRKLLNRHSTMKHAPTTKSAGLVEDGDNLAIAIATCDGRRKERPILKPLQRHEGNDVGRGRGDCRFVADDAAAADEGEADL